MNDQFDKILSERIKEVFEDYEDNSASVGWEELQKRLPKEKKKRPAYIWWSAAASLLLFLSLAYYLQEKEPMYLTGKTNKQEENGNYNRSERNSTSGSSASPRLAENATSEVQSTEELVNTPAASYVSRKTGKAFSEGRTSTSAGNENENRHISLQKNPALTETGIQAKESLGIAYAEERQPEKSGAILADVQQNLNSEKPAAVTLSLADLPASKKEPAKQKKGFTIGLYAGSYVNYAKGGKSGLNTGLGLVSEIGLSKKLKLSTGLTLAQNSLEYDMTIPSHAAQGFMEASLSSPTMNSDNKGMLPVTYSLNKYNVSMLGVDMPVNLKYAVLQRKNTVFLSAGLSSNFFVDQSYTYNYSVNNPLGTVASSRDEELDTKQQSWDIAKMLNFSVGFERPVWKQSSMSFEPFVKYPLGGMGTQDIRFGSVGLNLKLNLNGGKK